MSGIEVAGCVAAIITAFQGGADATKRIQMLRKKRKPEAKMLEFELQLSLEKGRDELARNKEMFITDCGYSVPGEEPYLYQVAQLYEVKSRVEAIRMFLEMLYDNEMPLKDPRKTREDADRDRFVAIGALTELRFCMRTTTRAPQPIPISSYTPPGYMRASPPMHAQRRAPPTPDARSPFSYDASPIDSRQHTYASSSPPSRPNASPFGQAASSPPIPQIAEPVPHPLREFREPAWGADTRRQEPVRPQPRHASSSESGRSRAPTWASEEASNRLTDHVEGLSLAGAARSDLPRTLAVEPPRPSSVRYSPTSESHRNSIATIRTTSSSNSNELTSPNTEARRPSSLLARFSSSRRKSDNRPSTIEHVVGEVRSIASAKNDWHGFCRGTFEISENPQIGLEVVQRPFNLHSTRMYLQCKRCAFPGTHHGTTNKTRIPESGVRVSAQGIRYRWMFLAKSHVKSPDSSSGVINVAEQTARSAYRCHFCYLENKLPDKLGGVETLMNHIWQHHRRKGMSDHMLRRAGCIIGRVADASEPFDINIPAFEPDDEHDVLGRGATQPGDVLPAGSNTDSASVGLGISQDGDSYTVASPLELSEMGRRGSPVELPGSHSYI